MEFEFDPVKSAINLKKHGLSLESAQALWGVPHIEVAARTVGEPRYMIVGQITGKCYSCIFTSRGQRVRLISARRSHKREEALYHAHI